MTALGAVVGAASEVIRNHFVASMIALSPIVIPLGAAVLAWKAVLEPVAQVLLPRLQTGFEAVSAALGKAADAVGRVAGGAFNKLGELLQPAWDGVKAGIEKVKPYLAAGANYIKESLGKVGTALAATGGAIATGIRAALAADEIKNSIYRGFQAVVGGIAGALRGISESAASYLQAPFQVLDTAIGAVSANVGRFVQLAQPGVMVQFQRAVNDLYATIGHALAPVLQTATRFFRSIGSALNGLTSDGTRLIQALAGGTAALVAFAAGVALVEAVATGGLAPLVEILVGGLTAGFAAAVTASGALDSMMDSFASTLGGVMNAVGAAFVSLEPLGKMVMGIIGDIGSMFAGAVAKVAQMISGSGIFGELAEIGKEVYDALRPVIEALFQVQGAIAGAELKFIKHAIELAGPALVLFARVIGEVASTVMYWTKSLLSLFVEVPDLSAPRSELRNNTGAAAGQVQTSTPSELLRRAMEATFGAGRANGRTDFASETAKNTSEIAAKADAIQKAITDELPKKVVEMIGVAAGIALKTAFGAGASSVSGAVGGAANTARDVAAGGGAGTGLQIAAIIDQHLRISDRLLSTFGFGHG